MTKTTKQLREENIPVLFNVMAAVESVKATPTGSTHRNQGDLYNNIIEIFKALNDKAEPKAIYNGLVQGGMKDITPKQVTNKLWGMAKPKKVKDGANGETIVPNVLSSADGKYWLT